MVTNIFFRRLRNPVPDDFTVMFVEPGYLSDAPRVEGLQIKGNIPDFTSRSSPKLSYEQFKFVHRNLREYGPYDEYLKNLKALYDALKGSSIRTVFLHVRLHEEDVDGRTAEFYKPNDDYFVPFENSNVMHMELGAGCILTRLPELPDKLYRLCLGENGKVLEKTKRYIHDESKKFGELLLFAGELADYRGHYTGELSWVAGDFHEHIPIAGIDKCIFPLHPYKPEYREWRTEIQEILYSSAVRLEQILERVQEGSIN